MFKVARSLAVVVLILTLLSVFGWMSISISRQDKDFGALNDIIEFMYSFPDLFSESVVEVKTLGIPPTFIKTAENFQRINKLESDLFILSAYSDTGNTRTVAIVNLKNDSTIYSWTFDQPIKEHERIFHPLLLPSKNLVYSYGGRNLIRVDSLSNVVWTQDAVWPHHAKELDSDGNIWVSTYPPKFDATGTFKINDQEIYFKDEYITKIDGETGEILFNKSITELLRENGLTSYLLKSGNMSDPIHTNDVEPALKTTPYYNEGDVLVSAKQLSSILHYRPATNELIDVIEGPFLSQHDVDFLGDTSIVLFNNNYYIAPMNNNWSKPESEKFLISGESMYSNIVQYDFKSDSYSVIADSAIKKNKIFSITEGLIDFYEPGSVFIEEQNSGILWIIKGDEVVYKNVLDSHHEGYHHLPNWTRIVNHHF